MEEETVSCTYCNKKLRGDDTVYYLDIESSLPYCSPSCLKSNLDIDEMLAKNWHED